MFDQIVDECKKVLGDGVGIQMTINPDLPQTSSLQHNRNKYEIDFWLEDTNRPMPLNWHEVYGETPEQLRAALTQALKTWQEKKSHAN